ncbi:LacI family DNA-binding transcriptional regulator [Microlunatus sp. GCM10028923]|uniref:LacI family DNA-binding transcriptional regulator n=1 Tax=Microlunatus sp. GCM10028923 TaxID=3273400 RepID=UPI00361124A2
MSKGMRGRPPTIRDVAARARVSMSTVSRVLNDSGPASPDARERVLRAVDELDFVTSASARTVRPDVRSMTWGLLVDDVDSHYFARIVVELDRAAQEHGSTLLVAVTQKAWAREKHLVKEMTSRRVDGLIVVPANGDEYGERQRQTGVPRVYLDRFPGGGITADVVTFDYYRAVADQVEELWRRGHRRIAFVGGEIETDPGTRRYAAWNDGLHQHGLPVETRLVSVGHGAAATARRATEDLLRAADPPTAIVTTTGLLLLGVLEAVAGAGATVEVAASEDIDAAFLSPVPLRLVQADIDRLAHEAVELLVARIEGADGPPQTRMLPVGHIRHGYQEEQE